MSNGIADLWEGIRGKADDPDWKYMAGSMAPITGELSDLIEVGAGLQDRSPGRIGLGLAALVLPGVGAPALRKLLKGTEQLPMDTASRLTRGKKMGFDLDVYHGTELPFDPVESFRIDTGLHGGRFGPGVYASTSPKDAHNWIPSYIGRPHESAELLQSSRSPRIYPLKVRSKKLIEYEGEEWNDLAEELGYGGHQSREKWHRNEGIAELAREKGWEGVFNPPPAERSWHYPDVKVDYTTTPPSILPEAERFLDSFDKINTGTEVMIFDPKNIRSRYAAFDPRKRHSKDMLAGIAGLAGARYALRGDRENDGI